MRIKKEQFLFISMAISVSVLLLAGFSYSKSKSCYNTPNKAIKCCQCPVKSAPGSPWHFITKGILHISA